MSDFYQRITDMQGSLEELARKIPGFKGYFEREDRRTADRLLREHLVRVFTEQSADFTRLQQRLVASGGIMLMEHVQTIDARLQTFIDRIRTAPSGYAGLFEAVKIDAGSLTNVYAFDNALLAYQDQFATGLRELEQAIGTDTVINVLDQLDRIVTDANKAFGRRVEVLQGMQTSV